MDTNERIAQFEHMCREDADNDMAWFSLANAYAQAERPGEAADAYLRCVELNPDMSKAFQLAGASLIKAGREAEAAEVLDKGYRAAASRGDLMPRDAMADLLKHLGKEPPKVETAEAPAAGTGSFVCQRTGKPGTQLPRPPFKGPVGAWIYENISQQTWNAWIGQGTKVINELRLDLSRDEDGEVYDQHMREYLGIDDSLLAQLQAPA